MEIDPHHLPAEVNLLQQIVLQLLQAVEDKDQLVGRLQHQLAQLLRNRYGQKRERIDENQLFLFAAQIIAASQRASAGSEEPVADSSSRSDSKEKKEKAERHGHGRKPLPESLERRRVVFDLEESQRHCQHCHTPMQKIGEDVSERLEFIPASLQVIEEVRPKYACAKGCGVLAAPKPAAPIEKGLPGPGLLAHVAVSKYGDHIPLNRMESIFQRHGVELSRKTMCNWMAACAELVSPVWERMKAVPERHLWANSYDRDLRDVLALHSEMSRAVADEVRVKLTQQEQGLLAATRPVNPDVYEAYLPGRYFWNRTDLDKALAAFQEAISKDPSYAPAHAGAALCYSLISLSHPPKEVFPKARAAAIKALELDDTVEDAHTAMAWIDTIFEWDWEAGEHELKRALELNPKSGWAHRIYGATLTMTGRPQEGIAEAKQAQQLDPLSLLMNGQLGLNYWLAHRYDDAIIQFRKTLELDRNYAPARKFLFWCYIVKSTYSEAYAEYSQYKKLPETDEDEPHLAYFYALSGRKQDALKLVHKLTRLSEREYVDPFDLVVAYVQLDRNQAFEWLEKAHEHRSYWMAFIKVDPFLEPMRSDPRFQDLLHRMNFPQ